MNKHREESSAVFHKFYLELETKKDKLLSFDPAKGGIDFAKLKLPKEELVKNKLLVKTMVLKDETDQLLEAHKFFGYFNSLQREQMNCFRDSHLRRYRKTFSLFAKVQIYQLEQVV